MTAIILAAVACCLWAGIVFAPRAPLVYAWKLIFLPVSYAAILAASLASAVVMICTAGTLRLDITLEDL